MFTSSRQNSGVRAYTVDDNALVGEIRAVSRAAAGVAPAWTPDSSALLPGRSETEAALWNVEHGAVTVLHGHTEAITAVATSTDHLATASADGTIRVRSLDGATLAVIDASGERLSAPAFDHAGRTLVGGGQRGSIRRWDVGTAALLDPLSPRSQRVLSQKCSADDARLLSGGSDGVAILQDAASGARLASFSGHGLPVYGVLFAPGGLVVTSAANSALRVWDPSTGRELERFGAKCDQQWMGSGSSELVAHNGARELRVDLTGTWSHPGSTLGWVACRVALRVEEAALLEVEQAAGCD